MPRPVVLTMHPNTESVWRDRVPDAADAVPFHVPTEPQGWHRRMDPDQWDRAYTALLGGVREVLRHPGSPIHVVAACPYSLGLLLGRRLEAHATLSVYQYDASQAEGKRWICWGPDGQSEPAQGGAVFLPVEGLGRGARLEVRDVALVVEVAVKLYDDVTRALPGLGLDGVPVVSLRVPEISNRAMSAPQAGAAEAELWSALERVRESYPNATVHLFYGGPLALLIRAGRRIHIGGQSVVCYEFGDDRAYHPAVRLPDGAPLWRPDALALRAPLVLEHLADQRSNSTAGMEYFNIKQYKLKEIPLSVRPPDQELGPELAWLLNDRLNHGPADPDNRDRAGRAELALRSWGEGAGQALVHALGGAMPGPVELALAGPGSVVAPWPWEWMRVGSEPLATQVPLWRTLPAMVQRAPPAGPMGGGPLRVLLAIARGASSDTREDVGYRNVARALLEVADLPDRDLEVEVLPRPCTLAALARRLQDRSRPVHVLHVDGHGLAGRLCLEDTQLCSSPVTADDLAAAVGGAQLRAVVLNACHSAAPAQGAPLDDLAVALHNRGVPAVVGMRAAMRVDAAADFSWAFYESLTRTGRVDLATMEGRAALARAPQRDSQGAAFSLPDWGVPVLYLRRGGEALRELWPVARATRSARPRPRAPMDRMLLQLDRALATSADGAVLVHGTLGSGKSALLREAMSWWRQVGGVGACVPIAPDAISEEDPRPGTTALACLQAARGAPRDGRVRILVWDDLDRARPWAWSADERRAWNGEIEDLTGSGDRLVFTCRDRLRWLQSAHRLPMEGLSLREARELGRARIQARADIRAESVAAALDAVERVAELGASNAACLDSLLREVVQGWTPVALGGLYPQDLPDLARGVYEALDRSLSEVRPSLGRALLSSLRARIVPGRAELCVRPSDAPLGGPLDLLERVGAISHWPSLGEADVVRYRIHPLLPVWLNEQLAGP